MISTLKAEQKELQAEIESGENQVHVLDVLTKDQLENHGELELKMMGLELSEEVWKQKWDDQSKQIEMERQRLEIWENELTDKELKANRLPRGAKVNKSHNLKNMLKFAPSEDVSNKENYSKN
jgi:hypothetical protein